MQSTGRYAGIAAGLLVNKPLGIDDLKVRHVLCDRLRFSTPPDRVRLQSERLDALASILAKERHDIVALQELYGCWYSDTHRERYTLPCPRRAFTEWYPTLAKQCAWHVQI